MVPFVYQQAYRSLNSKRDKHFCHIIGLLQRFAGSKYATVFGTVPKTVAYFDPATVPATNENFLVCAVSK